MSSKEFWENYKWKRHWSFVFMHPFPVQVQCCTKRRFSQFANCIVRQWGRRHAASSMQQTGIGWFSLGPTVWCIWDELDCNCSFVKEWKKQPKRLAPSRRVAVMLSDEENKRLPEKTQLSSVQVASISAVWSSPTHYRQWQEEQQAEKKEKQTKKQSKSKRRNCQETKPLRGRKKNL